MKKAALIGLVVIMAVSLYACRMRKNDVTTPDTAPVVTTTPEPTATEPTATEPTATEPTTIAPTVTPIAPNIPDSNVDDNHLIDPTEDATKDSNGLLDDMERKLTGKN